MTKMKARPVRSGNIGNYIDNSDKFWRGWNGGDDQRAREQWARMGMWMVIGVIGLMFATLAAIYVSRLSMKNAFPLELPSLLWISTALIAISSVTCQWALRAIRQDNKKTLALGLGITLILGLNFVVMQLLGWNQLMRTGMDPQKHLFSGLFYLFTGLHAIHLVGGIGFMAFVFYRALHNAYSSRRHLSVELGTLYWHFMDALWVALFLLMHI
ncbi:MAG: heme-copper oxidase subunit III [Fimbriimonadia bacterium]|nr:heme-copper oxidase subunit III [Fimbriimonadia bacterium]